MGTKPWTGGPILDLKTEKYPQMAVIRRALDSSRLAIWLSGEVTDKSTSDPGSGLQVSNVSV